MLYSFETFLLDTDTRELRRGDKLISIEPKVFDLLSYLILSRSHVVSKDDLIATVWSGRIVSESALTTCINAARVAVGDSGDTQRLIKTFPRKGIRFIGPVEEAEPPAIGKASELPAPPRPAAPTPCSTSAPSTSRLSIVVLPFTNLSDDPHQDYFVDGVTDVLTGDLSRISGLLVIARNTAFAYDGKPIDVRQIGRELNVRYVLQGAMQRRGDQLRVNVQLIDAEERTHLWAERFDKLVVDIFDLQDEIVSRIANTLSCRLVEIEAHRAERTTYPDAMDLCFQGRAWMNKGATPENLKQARGFLERALILEPDSIDAMVGIARADIVSASSHMVEDRTSLFAAAEARLTKALSLAPRFAGAHLYLGNVRLCTHRAEEGISACERALDLDPNLAEAYAFLAAARILTGHSEEAEAWIQRALRLSPRDDGVYRWLYIVGGAKLQQGADAEAVAWITRCLEINRSYPVAHFHLAAALALLGKQDEARAAVKDGLALDPHFTCRRFLANPMSSNPVFLSAEKRIAEGMRMAGVPEF